MVFSNYNNASYLPLDSNQGVTFYKNENLLFSPPPPPASSSPSVAMLTTTTGSSNPFSNQPLHHGNQTTTTSTNGISRVCEDFQPVAHLSSNGYYGYVPANSIPKPLNQTPIANLNGNNSVPAGTHFAGIGPAITTTISNGVGVLLDCQPSSPPVAVDDSSMAMMDCASAVSETENYHHHLRKRKENGGEQVDTINCKRRKTWVEEEDEQQQRQQHQQITNSAAFTQFSNWHPAPAQQMDCQDQPMESFPQSQPCYGVSANGIATFSGFHQQQQFLNGTPLVVPQPPQAIPQPKNQLLETASNSSSHASSNTTLPLAANKQPQHNHHHHFGDHSCCQELENLFISLHGSGYYLAC